MTERNERRFPDWAEQERAGDLAWIHENLHIFWPAAQLGYETVGRGAIVVYTTSRPTGGGHPFGYLDQMAIERGGDEETLRMVGEYEPDAEFVTALFKTHERVSSYRVRIVPAQTREKLDDRVEPGEQEHPSAALLEPPNIETLMEWEATGGCETACPHGKPSWLIVMGVNLSRSDR